MLRIHPINLIRIERPMHSSCNTVRNIKTSSRQMMKTKIGFSMKVWYPYKLLKSIIVHSLFLLRSNCLFANISIFIVALFVHKTQRAEFDVLGRLQLTTWVWLFPLHPKIDPSKAFQWYYLELRTYLTICSRKSVAWSCIFIYCLCSYQIDERRNPSTKSLTHQRTWATFHPLCSGIRPGLPERIFA